MKEEPEWNTVKRRQDIGDFEQAIKNVNSHCPMGKISFLVTLIFFFFFVFFVFV